MDYMFIDNRFLNNKFLNDRILGVIVLTVIFILYIQFSPTMGNIWWRNDKFMPMGAVNVILYPFKNIQMWTKPEMWIINLPMWIIIFLILSCLNYLV